MITSPPWYEGWGMCSAQYCLHCLDCCIILSFNSLLLNYQNLFTKDLIISVNSKQHTASSSYVIPPSFLSVNSVDDKFSWLSWMVVNRTICFVWSAAATLQGGYWYQILLPARFSWLLVTVRVRHNISQTRIIELINLVQSTFHQLDLDPFCSSSKWWIYQFHCQTMSVL